MGYGLEVRHESAEETKAVHAGVQGGGRPSCPHDGQDRDPDRTGAGSYGDGGATGSFAPKSTKAAAHSLHTSAGRRPRPKMRSAAKWGARSRATRTRAEVSCPR